MSHSSIRIEDSDKAYLNGGGPAQQVSKEKNSCNCLAKILEIWKQRMLLLFVPVLKNVCFILNSFRLINSDREDYKTA